MENNEIKKEAKQIMDSFVNALGDIELEEEFILVREECFREEGDGVECDLDFKERFLSNATKVKGDSILANKGLWVE